MHLDNKIRPIVAITASLSPFFIRISSEGRKCDFFVRHNELCGSVVLRPKIARFRSHLGEYNGIVSLIVSVRTRPRNPRFKDAHAGTKRSLKAKTINRDSGISGTGQSTESPILFRSCGHETPFSDQKRASKNRGFRALISVLTLKYFTKSFKSFCIWPWSCMLHCLGALHLSIVWLCFYV
jgi:hypothetical protein